MVNEFRRYGEKDHDSYDYQQMGQDLVLHFAGLDREQAYAVFLDNSLSICGEEVLHEGDVNSVGFSFRNVCDAALRHKAAYLILAHNHPKGVPIASSDDLNTTGNLKSFLAQMNVILVDHFIVAEGYFSSIFRESYEYLAEEAQRNRQSLEIGGK